HRLCRRDATPGSRHRRQSGTGGTPMKLAGTSPGTEEGLPEIKVTVQPPQAEQLRGMCRHFTGVLNRRCRAGILYEAVRTPDGGTVHPLPCFRQDQAEAVPCAFASFPSAEEVAERRARIMEGFQ